MRYHAAVLSDQHLRAGRGDDFVFDDQFVELVGELSRDGVEEIVLNGDFIDFVAMSRELDHPDPRLGFTEEQSLDALEQIVAAHPAVFAALARFVADGGRCVFVPGNHDWELHFPAVRERIMQALGCRDKSRLDFVLHGRPYRPRRMVHIEHGHQLLCDQNSFSHPRRPLRRDKLGRQRRIEQTLGNFILRGFVNPLEHLYPFVNNIHPISKVSWLSGDDDREKVVGLLKSFFARIWKRGQSLSIGGWLVETLWGDVVRSGRHTWRALSNAMTAPLIGATVGGAAGLSAPLLLADPDPEIVYPDIVSMVVDDQTHSFEEAARRIFRRHRLVRHVVFGHSHKRVDANHPFNQAARDAAATARPWQRQRPTSYVNPGSWNPCRSLEDQPESLPIAAFAKGAMYPFELNFVRVVVEGRRHSISRVETFERGEVFLAA